MADMTTPTREPRTISLVKGKHTFCFRYNEGHFIYPQACSGMAPSVPAASFTQDPETGFVAVNPGMMLLTVTGII